MEFPVIDIEQPKTKERVRTIPPRSAVIQKALADPMLYIRSTGELSMYEFLQVFWPEVSPDDLVLNWHMELLCDELQKIAINVANHKPKEYDLLINIPPGTTKTIICSIMFPAWCWSRWYWMRFICASHSSSLSLESAEKCRDIITSDKFKRMYPELGIKDDKAAKGNFRVIKRVWASEGRMPQIHYGGGRFSTSVGAKNIGFHGHINIWDDAVDPKSDHSDADFIRTNYWLDRKLSTRKIDKKVTVTIGIMQRLHQNDPTGHILEKKKIKIRHICLPGEIRNYCQYVKPPELAERYVNDLLDQERLGWDELKELEADLGQYGYAGQIGQNPTPPGGGMFKVDHFAIIQVMPAPVTVMQTVRYWDKAGTHKGGCYTVGVKMCRLVNKHYIVMDVKRGQWSSEEREQIIKETSIADGENVIQIVEKEGGSGGKESAEATVRNLAGYNIEVDSPQGDKVTRADPYSVQVNWGNVQLLIGEWNHGYIEEFRFFPFSKYKDQVDASSGAFKRLSILQVAGRVV